VYERPRIGYQLGADNEEAIESGAWWFYYKLGFRPRDREARALALREQERVTKRASYRSSPSTLRELALSPMVLQLYDKPRFPYGGVGLVGLHASHRLSERSGGLRSEGLARTSEEAAALLGGKRDARFFVLRRCDLAIRPHSDTGLASETGARVCAWKCNSTTLLGARANLDHRRPRGDRRAARRALDHGDETHVRSSANDGSISGAQLASARAN
jgi:hypothetical protein